MKRSNVVAKLARNEPVLLTIVSYQDPSLFELTSLMGFDGIWLDIEHHALDEGMVANLLRGARVGTADVMVRPAKGEFMRMSRMLEAGAQGIMYPRCDSAAEAREVVRWAKFAPQGTRGFDGANADAPFCSQPIADYIVRANRETFIVIQVEDPAAVEQADEIAAVDGVDVLFLGMADYSILGGFPGRFDDPRLAQAARRVGEAARRHNKHWGMPCRSLAHARELLDAGARFIPYGADILFIKSALERTQSEFGELGFTFCNRLSG